MKRMSWYNGELYIERDNGSWQHYSQHPLKVPDYQIRNGSKGYATMQRLFKAGYSTVNASEMSRVTVGLGEK